MPVYWLSENSNSFPHPELATPEGVLAVGGDLSPNRLLTAYANGIFPWYNAGEPIQWWSPDPRFVLYPDELKVSKSMKPYFNQNKFTVTFDQRFPEVIGQCQGKRGKNRKGTWITDEMADAYKLLHIYGYAHSVEVWQGEKLAGGLYGISLGKCFFGESMFTEVSNASKFGFISLVKKLREYGFRLIDCQQQTRHLASMGARAIPRHEFLDFLAENQKEETLAGNWGKLLTP